MFKDIYYVLSIISILLLDVLSLHIKFKFLVNNTGKYEKYVFQATFYHTLLSTVVDTFPTIFSGKVFLATLLVGHVFLSSAYSAVLTALLAVPKVNIPVDSLEDLVEYGEIPWASERGSAQTQVFQVREKSK